MINVKALGFEDIVYYEDRYEVVNVNDDSIDSITSFSTYLQAYKYYDENIGWQEMEEKVIKKVTEDGESIIYNIGNIEIVDEK